MVWVVRVQLMSPKKWPYLILKVLLVKNFYLLRHYTLPTSCELESEPKLLLLAV